MHVTSTLHVALSKNWGAFELLKYEKLSKKERSILILENDPIIFIGGNFILKHNTTIILKIDKNFNLNAISGLVDKITEYGQLLFGMINPKPFDDDLCKVLCNKAVEQGAHQWVLEYNASLL